MLKGLFVKFFHDFLGWHSPKEQMGFDGCSFNSCCRYCNKRILQDSWGGWFTTE